MPVIIQCNFLPPLQPRPPILFPSPRSSPHQFLIKLARVFCMSSIFFLCMDPVVTLRPFSTSHFFFPHLRLFRHKSGPDIDGVYHVALLFLFPSETVRIAMYISLLAIIKRLMWIILRLNLKPREPLTRRTSRQRTRVAMSESITKFKRAKTTIIHLNRIVLWASMLRN